MCSLNRLLVTGPAALTPSAHALHLPSPSLPLTVRIRPPLNTCSGTQRPAARMSRSGPPASTALASCCPPPKQTGFLALARQHQTQPMTLTLTLPPGAGRSSPPRYRRR